MRAWSIGVGLLAGAVAAVLAGGCTREAPPPPDAGAAVRLEVSADRAEHRPGQTVVSSPPISIGLHVIDDRGAIKLPTALRRLCGLECGVPVVLAAVVPEQVMVVHPSATVAQLLANHYTDLLHDEEDPLRGRGGHNRAP